MICAILSVSGGVSTSCIFPTTPGQVDNSQQRWKQLHDKWHSSAQRGLCADSLPVCQSGKVLYSQTCTMNATQSSNERHVCSSEKSTEHVPCKALSQG